MRIYNSEVDKSMRIKLNRTVKDEIEGVHGLQTFGLKNNYPQTIESLVSNSVTANAVIDIFIKFIVGLGFVDQKLNDVVVGKDFRGKKITLHRLLREVAQSIAINNGYYLHVDYSIDNNLNYETTKVFLIPFKNCRFPKADDQGYTAKVLVYDNWDKENETRKYNKTEIKNYHVFDTDNISKQIGSIENISKFKGQVFFSFLDNRFTYPLSPFDPAYLDMDTEYNVSLFRNREIRNGFTPKTIARFTPSNSLPTPEENERADEEKANKFNELLGADGVRFTVIADESLEDNGNVKSGSGIVFDNIETSIKADLFDTYDKGLQQNIRKAGWNVPQIFIDPDFSGLGNVSGEVFKQATNIYNELTQYVRDVIAQDFKEVFASSNKEKLRNADFKIKELETYKLATNGIIDNNRATDF